MRTTHTYIFAILLCYTLANGQTWTPLAGSATQISVGPDGSPWVVNKNNDIYHWNATTNAWTLLPGKATDIAVGSNQYGDVFVIGNNNITGGHGLYQYNPGQQNVWGQIKGAGIRVAVDPVSDPWIVDDAGKLYRRNFFGMFEIDGPGASDIGIGANGDVWVIGTTPASGGFEILKDNIQTGNWDKAEGGAVRIAVDPEGYPWVVNDQGSIYRMTADGWVLIPGTASDIGIGGNGDVWIIGTTEQADGGGYDILKFSEE